MKYKPFRIRAGYALYGSPYKDNAELERKSYTFGLGVDRERFMVDFAYVFSEGSDEHFMNSADLVDAANIITTVSHIFGIIPATLSPLLTPFFLKNIDTPFTW